MFFSQKKTFDKIIKEATFIFGARQRYPARDDEFIFHVVNDNAIDLFLQKNKFKKEGTYFPRMYFYVKDSFWHRNFIYISRFEDNIRIGLH